MPELPEVETLRREIHAALVNTKIKEVCIHVPTIIRQPSPKEFKKALEGATITGVLRKAKVLILELSNGKFLVIHLK